MSGGKLVAVGEINLERVVILSSEVHRGVAASSKVKVGRRLSPRRWRAS